MSEKVVLVIGGSGFVGSHVAAALHTMGYRTHFTYHSKYPCARGLSRIIAHQASTSTHKPKHGEVNVCKNSERGHYYDQEPNENGEKKTTSEPPYELPAFPVPHRLDVCDTSAVDRLFAELRPGLAVLCAAERDPGKCERSPERAMGIIADGASAVAKAAAGTAQCALVLLSTDHVLGGDPDGVDGMYDDDAASAPVNDYGRFKAEAERRVTEAMPEGTWAVLRLSMVHGPPGPECHIDDGSQDEGDVNSALCDEPWCRPVAHLPVAPGSASFAAGLRTMIERENGCSLFGDQRRCPVCVDDVVAAVVSIANGRFQQQDTKSNLNDEAPRSKGDRRLLPGEKCGYFNLAGPERLTRLDMGYALAGVLGIGTEGIREGSTADVDFNTGPRDTSMRIDRLRGDLGVDPKRFAESVASAFPK